MFPYFTELFDITPMADAFSVILSKIPPGTTDRLQACGYGSPWRRVLNNMATSGVRDRNGEFCVAGGPANVNCTNNSLVPGISMHIRSLRMKLYAENRQNLFKNIGHRSRPSRTSVLCLVHFGLQPTVFYPPLGSTWNR
ncbi:hypothetical protein QZH41_011896 [Actinostola sp. cb2023]|nr:hypothetical protein QZH41_011896 [Actinostola sp. cb2023]